MAVGILAQSVSRHLRVPGIVLLLFAGACLGPDGLAWIDPHALGAGLIAVVDLAVAVILFEGALNLEISRLRREQRPIRRLITWGALITWIGGALSARLCLDWPWLRCIVFGGLVIVTGPTVIGPLVRDLRLRPRVATLLEAEGVLIDPIGAIVAALLLGISLQGVESTWGAPVVFVQSLGFGVVAGGASGYALAAVLRVRNIVPEGYENIFAFAYVLLVFQLCDELVSHSGILAVTVAGVVVGNMRTRVDRDLREFKDQLTVLLIGLLFVLLAADVRYADVLALGWRGLAVVALLVLVVRPLNVALSTLGSELTRRERLFVAWIAPRGIVAAAVASVTATALESQGVPGGAELRAMVFLTIAGTVTLAGLTARPVAALLGVRLPGRDAVAILGAQGLGLELAAQLAKGGVPVVFLDSSPANCRRAEEAGYSVVYGDALQARTLHRARLELADSVIGLTPNQMLNSAFASRARRDFGVPRGYVAVIDPAAELASQAVDREHVMVLFDGPHDVERWDVRSRHGGIEIGEWIYAGDPAPDRAAPDRAASSARSGELFAILSIRRGKKVAPMHTRFALAKGDVAVVAIHRDERESAESLLAARGWSRLAGA
ncbi:MAG TPA: sodium:proton antiporter [Myxococcota bacterium]|nr:sodium:proton antiporter [Myxococcota bacterium]